MLFCSNGNSLAREMPTPERSHYVNLLEKQNYPLLSTSQIATLPKTCVCLRYPVQAMVSLKNAAIPVQT